MGFFNKNIISTIGVLSFIFFTCSTVGIALAAKAEPESAVVDGSLIVWSDQGVSGYPVYLSEYREGEWSETVQVVDNDKLNLVPCVTRDDSGIIWIVWAVFNSGDSELHFKRYIKGEWSEEQKIETGLTENTAPTIIIDNQQALWLAWSANDGVGDDIFFARWDGDRFEPAERITDTSTPDVLPLLAVNKQGKVWVQWQSFDNGTYSTKLSEWGSDEWATPSVTAKNVKSQLEGDNDTIEFLESHLPDMVYDHKKASIHIPGYEIQSLPLKFFELTDGE